MLREWKLEGLWEEAEAAVSDFLQLRGAPLPKSSLMLHNTTNKHGFLQLETLEGERGPSLSLGRWLGKVPWPTHTP